MKVQFLLASVSLRGLNALNDISKLFTKLAGLQSGS